MSSETLVPGAYIEEAAGSRHPIDSVATSVAAFIGWAARGPVDRPVRVSSWSEYERQFGLRSHGGTLRGEDPRSPLGYAVRHFFRNGGREAYVLRLAHTDAMTATVGMPSHAPGVALEFAACNPGRWAHDYAISFAPSPGHATRFRLSVIDLGATGAAVEVERFDQLTLNRTDPRCVTTIVNSSSRLIRVATRATVVTSQRPALAATRRLGGDLPGRDGTVFKPDAAEFERALLATGGTGGVNLLDRVDLLNLLCVPGETAPEVISQLMAYCRRRRAILIVDCNSADTVDTVRRRAAALAGTDAINAALYFPWVMAADPAQGGRARAFPPCGFVAGIYARTDAQRGVWKAPAGTDARLAGNHGLTQTLTDAEQVSLNAQSVNCLRRFGPFGDVVWGARTLHGSSDQVSDWKFVPVRRLALFIEESVFRGTQWATFEPNDEVLWRQLRLCVESLMQRLFAQGAFAGSRSTEAYYVKCGRDTMTQSDLDQGCLIIEVGIAPSRPAEFVVLSIRRNLGVDRGCR